MCATWLKLSEDSAEDARAGCVSQRHIEMTTKTPDQIKRELEARVASLKAAPVDPDVAAFVDLRESVANHVFEAMQVQSISKAELARRLGTSRAYVTKLLGGGANVSLETLAQLAQVLELEVSVRLVPRSSEAGEASKAKDGWSQCWDGKVFERPALRQIAGGSARRYPWQKSSARLSPVAFEGHAPGAVVSEATQPVPSAAVRKAIAA